MCKMRQRAACRCGPEVSIYVHNCIKPTWRLTRLVAADETCVPDTLNTGSGVCDKRGRHIRLTQNHKSGEVALNTITRVVGFGSAY